MNDILIPKGFKVGHADNGITGITVMLCEEGAVGGIDVRGCAPGTRETDLLHAEKAVDKVNAVALCGGSAFGLNACTGIMEYLKGRECGHKVGGIVVPLVSAAVIFDLNKGYVYPDADMGLKACKNAKNTALKWGNIGVGTGARIGKIFGEQCSAKGGVGAASVVSGEVVLTAITAVNALGDVYDPSTGRIICGARMENGEFLDTNKFILNAPNPPPDSQNAQAGANTTLVCILTNAKIDKLRANKLASIAHDGLAQCIKPVHTDYDGDTVFALSSGGAEVDFTKLSCMAVEAVIKSVLSVFEK